VAWRATVCGNVKATDSVLILGAGPIGLAILLSLKAQGVSDVLVSELSPARQKMASDLGAIQVLDPSKEDIATACLNAFDGEGAHVAFDCAGVSTETVP